MNQNLSRERIILKDIFEDIVKNGHARDPIYNLLELYFGICEAYPLVIAEDVEPYKKWPFHLRKFWEKINFIYYNNELSADLKRYKIYQQIKSKYFSLLGLRFPYK